MGLGYSTSLTLLSVVTRQPWICKCHTYECLPRDKDGVIHSALAHGTCSRGRASQTLKCFFLTCPGLKMASLCTSFFGRAFVELTLGPTAQVRHIFSTFENAHSSASCPITQTLSEGRGIHASKKSRNSKEQHLRKEPKIADYLGLLRHSGEGMSLKLTRKARKVAKWDTTCDGLKWTPSIHTFWIRDGVAGAAKWLEKARLCSLHLLSPTLLGRSQDVPRPPQGHRFTRLHLPQGLLLLCHPQNTSPGRHSGGILNRCPKRLSSESLPADRASHSGEETHFGCLYPQSCSFCHRQHLVTIGVQEWRSVRKSRALPLLAWLLLQHDGTDAESASLQSLNQSESGLQCHSSLTRELDPKILEVPYLRQRSHSWFGEGTPLHPFPTMTSDFWSESWKIVVSWIQQNRIICKKMRCFAKRFFRNWSRRNSNRKEKQYL